MASNSKCRLKQRDDLSRDLSQSLLSSWNIDKSLEGPPRDPATSRPALYLPSTNAHCAECEFAYCHYGLTDDECHLCLFPFWGHAESLPDQAGDLAKVHGDRLTVTRTRIRDARCWAAVWGYGGSAVQLSENCSGCRVLRACLQFLQTEFPYTLLGGFGEDYRVRKDGKVEESTELYVHWRQGKLLMDFRLLDELRHEQYIGVRPYLDLFLPKDSKPLGNIAHADIISGDTASDASLGKAKDWLARCSHSHAQCMNDPHTPGLPHTIPKLRAADVSRWSPLMDQDPRTITSNAESESLERREDFVPRRLIDVGGNGDFTVQLVEVPAKLNVVYICLSHCWGSLRSPCVTTQAKLQASPNLRSIFLHEMPTTFRDAVDVARRLNFRYLWIDSLCIIQDSEEDWREQSSEMANIFRSAQLTIAGIWASSDDDGLYSQAASRHKAVSHLFSEVKPLLSDGEEGLPESGDCIHIRVHLSHPDDQFGPRATAPSSMPLLTRAWVWQERLLSKRILYFGENELLWECDSARYCECASWQQFEHDGIDEFTRGQFAALTFQDPETVHQHWRTMVESYSVLDLTFAKDRLPALSGVAKVFDSVLNATINDQSFKDRYLAGMWLSSLNKDLAWRTRSPTRRPPGQSYGGPPTWSWAYVAGSIYWPDWDCSHFEILDASTTPVSSDPTGEIAGGVLIIEGILLHVSLVNSFKAADQTEEQEFGGTEGRIGDQNMDNGMKPDLDVAELDLFQMLDGSDGSTICLSVLFQSDVVFWTDARSYLDILAKDCFCFVLGSPTSYGSVPALLLKKVPHGSGDADQYGIPRYQRIGVLHVNVPRQDRDIWWAFEKERDVFQLV